MAWAEPGAGGAGGACALCAAAVTRSEADARPARWRWGRWCSFGPGPVHDCGIRGSDAARIWGVSGTVSGSRGPRAGPGDLEA